MADPCLCGQIVLPFRKGWGKSHWATQATPETGFHRWRKADGPCMPKQQLGQLDLFADVH